MVERQLFERRAGVETGHRDEDVDASELLQRLIDHALARGGIGEIGLQRERAPATSLHARRRRFGLCRGSVVDQRHVRARFRQLLGDDAADPFDAGEQRHFAVKVHGW